MCVFIASSRQSEAQVEKIKELRDKYETQLNQMRHELKQLQIAKREHAVALKKNVSYMSWIEKVLTYTCTYMYVSCVY